METKLENVISNMKFTIDPNTVPEPERPDCPNCGGLGMIWYHVPLGDPMFGKTRPCSNPKCPVMSKNRREQQDRVFKGSNWVSDYDDKTFEAFHVYAHNYEAFKGKGGGFCAAWKFSRAEGKPFGLRDAAKEAMNYHWKEVDNTPRQCLVLTGDVGVGKTMLAVAATNVLKTAGELVLFVRVYDLIDKIQRTYHRDYQGPSTTEVTQIFLDVPFLILDEFGVKNYTDNRLEILEAIIRYRDKLDMPFMATTNLSLNEFYSSWGKQIGDIVAKAHWVPVTGDKLRQTVTRMVETF